MSRIWKTCFLCTVLILGPSQSEQNLHQTTAILCAFDTEAYFIDAEISDRDTISVLGLSFICGELRGRRVVLAQTGVGKVNAAMTTTLVIEHFTPEEVIFTGVAGGINPDLLPGDIVIGVRTAQHDLVHVSETGVENIAVRNPVNGVRNPVFFPADSMLKTIAREASRKVELDRIITTKGERNPIIREGVIVTGDAFIASRSKKEELRTRMEADAVEMEGAAVAQVCHQHSLPCIVIRSLSDNADDMAAEDFQMFCRVAAKNSSAYVVKIIELLALNPG